MIDRLSQLTPDPRNARKHNQRNLGMIAAALQEVGPARSIVIDENGVVLAGNGVVAAATAAGLDRLQVIDADGDTIIAVRRSGLTAQQKQRLALYDNRAAEIADWDLPVLLAEPDLLNGMFSDEELNSLLAQVSPSLPEPAAQQEPRLAAAHMIEIYCSAADLDDFRSILNSWSQRKSVTINIS